jgi:DNA-directed RNA polymerase subunit K/omega
MNSELLKKAHEKIPSVPTLVNLISKRTRELINGAKPLINPTELLTDEDRANHRSALDVDKCDIALKEVADGLLIAEIDFDAIARAEDAKTKWNKHVSVNSLFAD